jgi:prepilin-type N-terminal cleavage/methylation domain-containing protein
MKSSVRNRKGFTLVELLVVIVIIALLAALLLPALSSALCSARQGVCDTMLGQLNSAAKLYYKDFGVYPPGTGSGSKGLATALKSEGAKKMLYFEFKEDALAPNGDILNPVHASSGEIIYYRNNKAMYPNAPFPQTIHNTRSVDIWAKDCQDNNEGVNNWD